MVRLCGRFVQEKRSTKLSLKGQLPVGQSEVSQGRSMVLQSLGTCCRRGLLTASRKSSLGPLFRRQADAHSIGSTSPLTQSRL